MGYGMNSGYSGWSMSLRAVAAYDDGEMPKSKWTKAAMLSAIKDYCEMFDMQVPEGIEKVKKTDMFNHFFECSSWHHTSKYCNVTYFYSLDEDFLCRCSEEGLPEYLRN